MQLDWTRTAAGMLQLAQQSSLSYSQDASHKEWQSCTITITIHTQHHYCTASVHANQKHSLLCRQATLQYNTQQNNQNKRHAGCRGLLPWHVAAKDACWLHCITRSQQEQLPQANRCCLKLLAKQSTSCSNQCRLVDTVAPVATSQLVAAAHAALVTSCSAAHHSQLQLRLFQANRAAANTYSRWPALPPASDM
jgi:hypothetical protein